MGQLEGTHLTTSPPKPLHNPPSQSERERRFGTGLGTGEQRARRVGAHQIDESKGTLRYEYEKGGGAE